MTTQPDEIDKILDKTFVYGVGTTSDDIRGNDTAYINLKNHAIKEAHQAITTMIRESQTNAVAWTIGVVDELHSHVGEDGSFKDYDLYKGIKNTIRDKYKDITNIDPAPSYPVHAKLKDKEQGNTIQSTRNRVDKNEEK